MIEIYGKAGIRVRVLADSINSMGDRLTTYEIVYPRPIHSELLTHGMLVKNAASSRAIPYLKMLEQLTGRPVRFGEANKGMQDKGESFDGQVAFYEGDEDNTLYSLSAEEAWNAAKKDAVKWSKRFFDAKFHKQIYNRLTEPFQMMKTVISGTEWDNFYWLRNHEAADPTLEELARCIQEAKDASVPAFLSPGEWHVPYVEIEMVEDVRHYFITDGAGVKTFLTPENAVKVSAARCAAVSFRNEGYDLAKTLEVYERLVGDERKHASAFQHQATPMKKKFWTGGDGSSNVPHSPYTWEPGVSHMDRNERLWSAQFCGWVMNRKLIPGENYTTRK